MEISNKKLETCFFFFFFGKLSYEGYFAVEDIGYVAGCFAEADTLEDM